MRIACVKCSTLYELDERLIPPAGAPVQCTRCGHVFTAKPGVEAAPARLGTQQYGGPPAGAPRSDAAPGSVLQPPASGASAESRGTQLFAGSPVAAAPARASTQLFGAVPATGGAPAPTQMFGARPERSEAESRGRAEPSRAAAQPATARPEPTRAAAQPANARPEGSTRSATQMFGSSLLERAAIPPTGTIPFGDQGAPKAPSEGGNARSPSAPRSAGQSTQPFSGAGGAGAKNADPAPARSGTHLYGENHPLHDGPATASSTMPFAGSPSSAPARAASKEPAKSPAVTTTMPFAGGAVQPAQPRATGQAVRSRTPHFGTAGAATSADSPPKQATRAPVALPPENPADSPAARRRAPIELPAAAGLLFEPESQSDPEAAVRAQLQRRNRTALVIVIALVIGIPAILVIRTIAKRRSAIPAQVIAAEENAIGLLRRDDRHSRAQAIKDIEQLVQSHAAVASVRALQVLALTLELDDVKVGVKRIQAQSEEINRKLARMRERRSPSDWETQITRGIAQLQSLKQQSDPLVDEASSLDKKVNAAFPELLAVAKELSGPEELAVTRAEAVYFGVKGSDRALHLSERYRLLGGKDGWDVIAFGEYAANAHVAPDTLAQARAGLEGLRTSDSAFLRAYVLAARLALAQREPDAASTLIEAAVALNPSHELARQLAAWVDESRRSEPTWPTPPVGPPK